MPLVCPTAVQAVVVVQETLDNRAPPPDGLGVGWIDQAVPFHCSARVALLVRPTAVQAVVVVQETLDRAPPPEGLGVGWIDQSLPFHRSASVICVPVALST